MWCPPCQFGASREANFAALADSVVGPDNWEMVTLLAESPAGGPTTQTLANAWDNRFGTPSTLLHADGDATADAYRLRQEIGLEFYPTYFVLRTDGRVDSIIVGYDETRDLQTVGKIRRALRATPDGAAKYLKFFMGTYGLSGNTSQPLTSSLDAAIKLLGDGDPGNDAGARALVNVFIKQVQAMAPNKISETTAAGLISLAEEVLALIPA